MIARRLLPSLVLAAPSLAQTAAEQRVGAMFPASSILADEALRGLELAAEERARPARVLRADVAEPAQVLAEARRLVQVERCGVLFGSGGTASALATLQAAEALEVPVVELVSLADAVPAQGSRWLVRPGPGAADHGALAADVLLRALPVRFGLPGDALRVSILHEALSSPESLALAAEAHLREAGITVAERLSHAPRTAEMGALLQRARAAGVDALLHAGHEADAAALLRALSDGPWRPRVVLGLGPSWSLAELSRIPGIEGSFVLDVPPILTAESHAPGARIFAEAYQRRWGAAPRGGLSLATFAGARAVLASGAERLALRQALAAQDIAAGKLPNGWGWRLDERGRNLRAAPVVAQWQDGRPVAVWPEAAAAAPIRPG